MFARDVADTVVIVTENVSRVRVECGGGVRGCHRGVTRSMCLIERGRKAWMSAMEWAGSPTGVPR